MLFKTLEDIKEFITWAKAEGLKEIQVGELKVVVSDLQLNMSLSEKFQSQLENAQANTEPESQNLEILEKIQYQAEIDEDRDLLFHSTPL